MAFPHAGIFGAAREVKNGIMQPSEMAGLGEYMIRASVPSPAMNVLCVNMNADELTPLVYTEWPYADTTNATAVIPGQKMAKLGWDASVPKYRESEWLNQTVVDDIFNWGQEYNRRSPVFAQVSS